MAELNNEIEHVINSSNISNSTKLVGGVANQAW
jgi:hypothetical protein